MINNYSNTNINGNVEVKGDHEILFTTIPYDDCWNVKVDGNDAEIISLLDDAFIGVRVPKGNHSIEFSYKVLGLKGGIILSLAGALFIVLKFYL